MISVHIEPLAGDSALDWIDSAAAADSSGLISPTFDSTNAPTRAPVSTILQRPSRIDRTIDFAMSNYENLLRRLAD